MTREVIYSILTNDQRQRLETDWQIDFAYSIPGKARFRVNAYFQRASLSAALPADPPARCRSSRAWPAAGARGVHQEAARVRARHRPDRLGQVDHARRDARPDQRHATSTSSRSRTRSSSCTGTRSASSTSASWAPTRRASRSASRPALRQDPDVILVGEMRDLETISTALTAAETGPPRVRHAPHAGHGADRGPHRGRVPARPAAAGPRAALGVAAGHRHPAAAAHADGTGRSVATEVLVPRRRCAT